MSLCSPRLLAPLLAVAALLLAPGFASAQTTTTTHGGTTNSGSGTSRIKQDAYSVTQDATLDTIELWVGSTGTLTAAVWEQVGGSGNYNVVFQRAFNPGSNTVTWRTIGSVNLPLTAGNNYLIGFHIGGTTASYSYSSSSTYPAAAWGQQFSWADTSASSFPSSQLPSAISIQSGGGYYQRLTVTVNADVDNDGFTTAQGDCNDNNNTVYPGATEVCDDAIDQDCVGGDLLGDVDNDTYENVACGGTDCDDGNSAVNPGVDGDNDGFHACLDCDDGNPAINPSVDGDNDGADACADCDDGDILSYPGAPELCDGLDNDCDGTAGNAGTYQTPVDTNSQTGTGYFRGGKFLATTTTTLAALQTELTVLSGSVLDWVVYEATSETGTYSLVHTHTTQAQVSTRAWHASDPIGVTLTAGRWYVLGATWSNAATLYYAASGGVSFPYTAAWGTHQGGASSNTMAGVPPATSSFATSGTSYNLRVLAGSVNENDGDSDGIFACNGDCDDNAVTVFPGAPELCDGLDNDCTAGVPANEGDGDNDGSLTCADCDDNNATVYPGAPELCDGLDNDCDTFGDGVDIDNDGFFACNDCDDNDPTAFPGGTEVCDGADNDCDGTVGTGTGTGTPLTYEFNGSTSFSGGTRYRGNVFQATQDVLVTQLAAEVTTSTVVFRIFESTSTTGTWTQVGTAAYAGNSGGWYHSAPLNVQLTSGRYYAMFAQWSSTSTYYSLSTTQNPTWGNHLGWVGDSGVPANSTTLSNGTGSGYSLRVVSSAGVPNDEVDLDNDGFYACEECDDGDPTVMPGGPELCNGLDDNCDNAVPANELDGDSDGQAPCAGDCDDGDATSYQGATEICDGVDNNCDGTVPVNEADTDNDGWAACEECNDGAATIYPFAPEICDGLDNDCNNVVPLNEIDNDNDGYDECGDGDCDDGDASEYPGAPEVCDGADNDCDGSVPANENDLDLDGQRICAGDCNDVDSTIYTGAPEICDALDNDCNGAVPGTEVDNDLDGVPTCADDCDDNDPQTYPGAIESCDGVDNDCNGVVPGSENDNDNDGYRICDSDCNDNAASTHPGATELCNGLDDDCNGLPDADSGGEVDFDFDGSRSCEDCDDNDSTTFPGNPEVCDGADNDCDGSPDFDAAGEADADDDGWLSCEECDDGNADTQPGADEICDGEDNDCNGVLPQDEADNDGDAMAPCEGDCDDNDPLVFDGAPEVCDQMDNDCDGTFEDENEDDDGDGHTPCDGDCDDTNPDTNEFADEICDGEDNDCNGQIPNDEQDADADGWLECEGDCEDENPAVNPDASEDTEELCNDGLDNDCDGDRDRREPDCDGLYQAGDDDDSEPVDGRSSCACDAVGAEAPASLWFLGAGLLGLLSRRTRRSGSAR